MNDELQSQGQAEGFTDLEPKKKRGRPKGSKNKKRVEAVSIPAQCPTCKSTDIEVQRLAQTRYQRGKINDFKYSQIEYRRCKCRKCGQHLVVRTYQ